MQLKQLEDQNLALALQLETATGRPADDWTSLPATPSGLSLPNQASPHVFAVSKLPTQASPCASTCAITCHTLWPIVAKPGKPTCVDSIETAKSGKPMCFHMCNLLPHPLA